jgi:peptidoglycan/LPS O-acetylase OafA/YrhL
VVVRKQALSARKLVALDGIRGLAILAVALHHSSWRLNATTIPERLFAFVLYQGWAGVDLFFVLSGFLITGILLDSRPAVNYFRSFYARRALRIFPLYFAFLLLAFGLFPFFVPADFMPVPRDRWLYLCYLTNWLALWVGPWRHSVMAHLWSLAVEEQFYFCWPLLVRLVHSANLIWCLLIGELTIIAGRCWWVAIHGPSQSVALATITRMDGLLLGAVCAILVRRYYLPDRLLRQLPVVASCGLITYLVMAIAAPNADRYAETVGFPLLAVCFSLVVLYAVLTEGKAGPTQAFLCKGQLTLVGKYAYGLYVYHVPLFYFGDRLIDTFVPARVRSSFWFGCTNSAVLIVISYHVARLSYAYFERYFLNLKDRFEAHYASP